jgi:hypothetical protein
MQQEGGKKGRILDFKQNPSRPFLFLFILFSLVGAARAQGANEAFRTEISNCPDEITSRLPAIVKLEIDVLMRERGSAHTLPDRVEFRCEDDAARIEVTSGSTSRSATIRFRNLLPEHRARALALAAAELVHGMWLPPPHAEPAQAPTPSSAASTPQNASDTPREPMSLAPSPAGARPAVFFGGLAELIGRPTAHLFGARMGLIAPLGAIVAPALTIDGAIGRVSARSADVIIDEASAAAHLYFGTNTGRVRWDLGPGGRLGWAYLAGRPSAGSGLVGQTLTAFWGGPELRARIAYSLVAPRATNGGSAAPAHAPSVALELGGGLIALPIHGLLDGTDRVYGVEGGWASASLELGFGL